MIKQCIILIMLLTLSSIVALYTVSVKKERRKYIETILKRKYKMSAILKSENDLSLPAFAYYIYIYDNKQYLKKIIDWAYGKEYCKQKYRQERTLFTKVIK